MTRQRSGSSPAVFGCAGCGYRTGQWMGFCPRCRDEGGLQPVGPEVEATPVRLADAGGERVSRRPTGIGEVDRVLGGGLVPGCSVLVGGEPGVGKSTLLLQVAGALAAGGGTALMVTAEESMTQVALRARRVGTPADDVWLLSEPSVETIAAAVDSARPDVVIVDSIQTVYSPHVDGSPGGVSQVRESAARLVGVAKDVGAAVVLVGHVTKDGALAGPKLLEHMVDVVLYLEGDTDRGLRFLRGLKNRFGAVNEIGVFEMSGRGLVEVEDPSDLLIADRLGEVAGTVLYPALEGRRPLMVEIQALVAPGTPQPRRSVKGLESARVQQLLAVLERHAGLSFSQLDVFVGVAGGIRVREPAADLPVALALASSLLERPIGALAAWGEVGLTGELRSVGSTERRLKESSRLGIGRAISPSRSRRSLLDALLDAGLVVPADGRSHRRAG